MKTNRLFLNYYPPSLEITTKIGCKVACKYCPQELLVRNYRNISNILSMTLETFTTCIDKVPSEINIHFSGMSEPWLNKHCTEMLLYAAKKHRIVVFTTLVGMSRDDFIQIKNVDFLSFNLHLPDANNNSNIPINNDYLNLLEDVVDFFQYKPIEMGFSCHGKLHPVIENIIPNTVLTKNNADNLDKKLIDRAGNLGDPIFEQRYHKNPIQCILSGTNLNRNVLLPNGLVLLCCMDYAIEAPIGNLLVDNYGDLFRNREFIKLQEALKNDQDVICRKCHNAVPWVRPYQTIEIPKIQNQIHDDKLMQFCLFLADRSGIQTLSLFSPKMPISFISQEVHNSIALFPNITHLMYNENLPSWSAIEELLNNVNYAVLFLPIPGFINLSDKKKNLRLNSLVNKLSDVDLRPDHVGWLNRSHDEAGVAVLFSQDYQRNKFIPVPQDFKITALLAVYNEVDIIQSCVDNLIQQGIDVYIIDNWSTDGTYEIIQNMRMDEVIGYERWPVSGPLNYYDLESLLIRKEELSYELNSNWYIHHDADEIREAPWINEKLRDAIWIVDQAGYNAIDFTVIDFFPVDNSYTVGKSVIDSCKYFNFGTRPGHFLQIRAWKNSEQKIDLHSTGGHKVAFSGQKIFPIKFLLRHYPLRSQQQAEKKIFIDRLPRFYVGKKKGWHNQYDHYRPGDSIIKKKEDLLFFNDHFYNEFLIQRLSGIGIEKMEINDNKKNEVPKGLFAQPNKYARTLHVDILTHKIVYHGYQEFELTQQTVKPLDIDLALRKKYSLLKDFFTPNYLFKRKFLDIGANSGFFSFWALQNGADKAFAIDIDQDYLNAIRLGKEKFDFDKLEIINENIMGWSQPGDVVLALALVHWVYSCTALYGSLDATIKKLADITNYMLIIEWIEPDDQAINFFNHIQWNNDLIYEPYTFDNFIAALSKYFVRYEYIGDISSTRKLFIAFKTEYMVDLSVPFELIMPVEKLISSRFLASLDGIDYWSSVYKDADTIIKQATLNLGEREAIFLRQLDSEHFPKVYETWTGDGFSVAVIEKIKGSPLEEVKHEFQQNLLKMNNLIDDIIIILELLHLKSIRHRDIRMDNLLFRNEKLVLIDFGWAESFDSKISTPPFLGGDEKAPDGNHCDVYSMGKVIENVNANIYEHVTQLAQLMANRDPVLRITNLNHLRTIWKTLKAVNKNPHHKE